MNKVKALIAVSMTVASTSSFAAGGYLGATVGQAELDISGYDDANSYSFLVGYQANPNLAFEFAYFSAGKAKLSERNSIYSYDETAEVTGPTVSLLGILPANEHFAFFAKAGVWFWDADYSYKLSDSFVSFEGEESENGSSLFIGLGGQLSVNENVKLSLEYTQYEAGDEVEYDIDNISLGARYYF